MAWEATAGGASTAAAFALVSANIRYWVTVLPDVRRGLRGWEARACEIPDPMLRAHALGKLRRERFNTEVAATLATLAPKVHRRTVVEAIVAIEVMYDYLDGLTEQTVADPLANGRQLYRAFEDALLLDGPRDDPYRHHPQHDDGGYLDALAAAAGIAVWSLPAAAAVVPVARAVAARCGEAQTRTHAVAREGAAQLRAWAIAQGEDPELQWFEVAAGAAASVLTLHALVAAAADPATTVEDARRIADAYLATCALTTLLDSLVDLEADAATGGHAYIAYYGDEREAAERLGRLARRATAAARGLPRAPHHLMTVAGAVAFYLSAPAATREPTRGVTRTVADELQPLLAPTLAIFELWRRAKRARSLVLSDAGPVASPTVLLGFRAP